jgi:pyruvate-formate lyase
MYLTKEERNIVKNYLPLIEKVVRDNAISNITYQFREEIIKIAVKHKLVSCVKCNSALYSAIQKVYTLYVADMREENNKKKNTNKTNGKKKDS